MNHTCKTLFNRALNVWQVVFELATSHGKTGNSVGRVLTRRGERENPEGGSRPALHTGAGGTLTITGGAIG
jgi:hypothetical protein